MNKFVKMIVSALLSLIICMVFTMSASLEASAASPKTKKYQLVDTVTINETWTEKSDDEEPYSDKINQKRTYVYNKEGLRTSVTSTGGGSKYTGKPGKEIYKYNSKGYVTETKIYDTSGKQTGLIVYTRKNNGDASKVVSYSVNGKKKTNAITTTYTYHKKGVVKKQTTNYGSSVSITNYDKRGNITSEKSTYGKGKDKSESTTNYTIRAKDKKGNATKITGTTIHKQAGKVTYKESFTTTSTYTYDKSGRITKSVSKTTFKENGDTTRTEKITVNNTYKSGRLSKTVYNYVDSGEYYTSTYKRTDTYSYRSVKVEKKYWNLYK